MHGSTRTDPRWCLLDDWALVTLQGRAEFVAARQVHAASAPWTRLAVSDHDAPDCNPQARACVALRDLLVRIGLGGEADVKPSSVTAWAGVDAFERTGRIEQAARCLGPRSLDRRTAPAIPSSTSWPSFFLRPVMSAARAATHPWSTSCSPLSCRSPAPTAPPSGR
ncbi:MULTISPECIES: hypothetical protein [unclassified Streptomyces]|uniref:hypothetical protein n=1 Tax=unclassified Streptomyces TaxID=2593676 RepID=UPI00381CB2C7